MDRKPQEKFYNRSEDVKKTELMPFAFELIASMRLL